MPKNNNRDDIKFIEALADLLNSKDMAEIEVLREYAENDALEVRIAKFGTPAPMAAPFAAAAPAPAAIAATPAPVDVANTTPNFESAEKSPMVGTVYLAPEPGAANFVSVGERVEVGQTILIIEAMKTMNQIPASKAGVVKQILVSDATPVEFGDALVIIE